MSPTLGRIRVVCRIPSFDAKFIKATVTELPDEPPPPPEPDGPPPRLRRISISGTGRGTGRGGKPAADVLTRRLKPHGKRSDFIKYIGGREVSVETLRQQFDMTVPNINGYLTNIHRDHGIGYEKEGGTLRLILPPGCNWKNVWGK
jgi:hypothetical protein